MGLQRCETLAPVLEYPDHSLYGHLENCCRTAARGDIPEAAQLLAEFASALKTLSLGELEELYCRTFDINPVACLNVGWHLFGEQYERGNFLVKMRQMLRRQGIRESAELPDHLPQVLRLLANLETAEANQLAAESVLPAVRKMIEGLGEHANPYQKALRAVELILSRGSDPRNGGRHG